MTADQTIIVESYGLYIGAFLKTFTTCSQICQTLGRIGMRLSQNLKYLMQFLQNFFRSVRVPCCCCITFWFWAFSFVRTATDGHRFIHISMHTHTRYIIGLLENHFYRTDETFSFWSYRILISQALGRLWFKVYISTLSYFSSFFVSIASMSCSCCSCLGQYRIQALFSLQYYKSWQSCTKLSKFLRSLLPP